MKFWIAEGQEESIVTMSKWRPAFKEKTWMMIVFLVFGTVYSCSLVFTYIDIDDATSLAYHVLGRNESVQPPFERFQLAMDVILSFLPADEPIVRSTAMGVSSLGAIGLTLLLLQLCFECLGLRTPCERALLAGALLLASPELIYLGLLYTPMLLGMCFAVGAHLLLRRGMKHFYEDAHAMSPTSIAVITSGILMGIAGIFRFDIMGYGLVIVLDSVLDPFSEGGNRAHAFWNRARIVAVWGILALVIWSGIVLLRGDLEQLIAETRVAVIETKADSRADSVRVLASYAMFFSPAFLVAALGGWFLMIRKEGSTRWFVVAMTLFAVLWPFWSTPKEVLVFIPCLALLFATGLLRLWRWRAGRVLNLFIKSSMIVLLLVPWFLGVQLLYGDSSWGPGFELRPFTHPKGEGIQNIHLVFGDGAGIPTDEGPRPFFGHASVLLAGKWYEHAKMEEEEHLMAVKRAIQDTIPYLVVMDYDGFQLNNAVRLGYTTTDPECRRQNASPIVRNLRNHAGQKMVLLRFELERILKDTCSVLLTIHKAGSEKVLVWGEPGIVRQLFLFAPDALQELGLHTGLLDLRRILAVARSQTKGGSKRR